MFCFKCYLRDFRDDSMVKTLPSNVWDANSIPGQETKIQCAAQCGQTNKQDRSHRPTTSHPIKAQDLHFQPQRDHFPNIP